MADLAGKKKNSTYNPFTEKPIEVYISGISGLRALGIFGVIFYHMFPYDIKGGFLGVTLFFIISGYLLAVKSEEARRIHKFSIGSFYLKRVKRLYPQLIIALLFVCGVCSYFNIQRALSGVRSELLSILLGYNNIWQINKNASYFERIANSSPFTHMWSLSNEIQMYVIWPFIFLFFIFLVKKMNIKKAINVIGIITICTMLVMPILFLLNPEADVTRLYYGTDTRIFSFLTGAYIGFRRTRYRQNLRIKDTRKHIGIYAVLTAVIIISYIFMDGEGAFTYLGGMLAVNIIFAVMLVLVTDVRLPIGKFMDNKYFKFFGDISYEMYLCMYPVIFVFHALHINQMLFAPVLMLLIIVILAKWLNMFARMLVTLDFKIKGIPNKRKLVKGLVTLAGVFVIAVSVMGGSSVLSAPDQDLTDLDEMKKELAEHAAKLESEEYAVIDEPNDSEINENEKEDESDATSDTEDGEETGSEGGANEGSGMVFGERTITAVGDSVMLGAAPSIMETFPGCVVDAAESRQVVKTLEILQGLEADGRLGNTVILAVGTNGPFKESTGQEIIDYLGPDRDIYWVNVFGDSIQWVDDSNSTINALVEANSNVTLIDWHTIGRDHPDWFYNDGIHLRPDGQKGYAEILAGIIK